MTVQHTLKQDVQSSFTPNNQAQQTSIHRQVKRAFRPRPTPPTNPATLLEIGVITLQDGEK